MPFDHGHALLIGVGTYAEIPWANIPIAVSDARQLEEVLLDATLCGYRSDQVSVLHDETASLVGIMKSLEMLARKTTPENTVLLFYCGHGEYGTDGNYYLTTHDTQVSAEYKIQKGTGLSEAVLIEKLRTIPAKRLLLLINACHSGEISTTLELGDRRSAFGSVGPPQISIDAILSTGEGRIIITACRPAQKSWIGDGPVSIFTQALIDGLSGTGSIFSNNGYVSVFSLYEHLYLAVRDRVRELNKVQEPELTVLKNVGPFPVSLFRGATDLGEFNAREAVPADTAAREVSPKQSQRCFNNYMVKIDQMSGGFLQPGMQVRGGLKQAGRDYYEGTKKRPR